MSLLSGVQPIAAILAGGASSRMGSDKALLVCRGMTLLERAARSCCDAGLPTIVVGREAPDGWPIPDVRFIPDDTPGQGPLAGLAAALTAVYPAPVLAIACDMPLLNADALRWLVQRFTALPADSDGLSVTDSTGRLQPLFSVYGASMLAVARRRLAEGRRSLQSTIEAASIQIVPAPEWLEPLLANVNTPEDLLMLSE